MNVTAHHLAQHGRKPDELTDNSHFGVGLSVWPEDYDVMGVPWERRGRRFDECIAIVRGLTAGGGVEALSPMLAKLQAYQKDADADRPFRVYAAAMGNLDADEVRRHEDVGVTDKT